MVARPQQQEKDAPWPIVVTRQGLLNAAWGSKKGADLLWHFINKARWEIKNQNLSTSVKVIIFQEKRTDIFAAIESAKAGNSISQGTYNTLLRAFTAAGYVVNQPYSDVFEVHLDAIEEAFTNPPQKPGGSGKRVRRIDETCVNSTHYNTDTISRKEYDSLLEVCVNVSKMCQSLSIQVAELTQLCQSLTHYNMPEAASDGSASASIQAQSNDIDSMLDAYDSSPLPPIATGEEKTAPVQDEKPSSSDTPAKIVYPDFREGLREYNQQIRMETPAQIKKRIDRRKADIFALYARLTNVSKVVKSKENQDGADMLTDIDATDEDITIAVEEIQKDAFWAKQMSLRVVANQLQSRVNDRKKRSNGQSPGTTVSGLPRWTPPGSETKNQSNHCLYSDEELEQISDRQWAKIQAGLASPEVQATLAAKGIQV